MPNIKCYVRNMKKVRKNFQPCIRFLFGVSYNIQVKSAEFAKNAKMLFVGGRYFSGVQKIPIPFKINFEIYGEGGMDPFQKNLGVYGFYYIFLQGV